MLGWTPFSKCLCSHTSHPSARSVLSWAAQSCETMQPHSILCTDLSRFWTSSFNDTSTFAHQHRTSILEFSISTVHMVTSARWCAFILPPPSICHASRDLSAGAEPRPTEPNNHLFSLPGEVKWQGRVWNSNLIHESSFRGVW